MSYKTLFNTPHNLLTKANKKWYPIYLEYAKIVQNEYGITAYKKDESIDIPVGVLSCLLLGPGTSITHGAIKTCSDCQCDIHWVGEDAMIYYATGIDPVTTNENAMKQIEARCNKEKRLDIVRKMFLIRYKDFDVEKLNIKNMMGHEGIMVKNCYEELSDKYKTPWIKRSYNTGGQLDNQDINFAISYANSLLYSVCFSVIISMGFLPSIGFIHNGSMRDFVLDISDIYKKEISLDASFESISRCGKFNMEDIKQKMYRNFENKKILKVVSEDLQKIFDQ